MLTYGIRTDFRETSRGVGISWLGQMRSRDQDYLSLWKKATMNARIDPSGKMETSGAQIEVGGMKDTISM